MNVSLLVGRQRRKGWPKRMKAYTADSEQTVLGLVGSFVRLAAAQSTCS